MKPAANNSVWLLLRESSLEKSPLNVSLSSERPPFLHPSVDTLSQHRHTHTCAHKHKQTHTSIFKHAASAWRHDTTAPEPKYIQGHSGIAFNHMQWSRFHLLAHFILSLLILMLPQTAALCTHMPLHSSPALRVCCTRLEGPRHLDSLKVISASLRAESWCPSAIAAPAVVNRISNQLCPDQFLLVCLLPLPLPTSLNYLSVFLQVCQTNTPPFLFLRPTSLTSPSYDRS